MFVPTFLLPFPPLLLALLKLQQVLPVFQIFIEKYSDVSALSKATTEEIKEAITSLGLQNIRSRRARAR